jgi:hypothetical protein
MVARAALDMWLSGYRGLAHAPAEALQMTLCLHQRQRFVRQCIAFTTLRAG